MLFPFRIAVLIAGVLGLSAMELPSARTAHPRPAGQWVAKKKKKDKKKKEATTPPVVAPSSHTQLQTLDLGATSAEPNKTIVAPALDLSSPPPPASPSKGGKTAPGTIDFGGGLDLSGPATSGGNATTGDGGMSFDFGGDQPVFTVGNVGEQSAERKRFDAAMNLMSDEDYEKAALEFKFFLTDAAYASYQEESQYQLGKALYKLNFYEGALKQYQNILEKGPTHRRYRKAVEWLFFMSRKLADQTPVLAQLARYRNVTFPKAYRNEYNYLLAKYLFVQADNLEVKRIQDEDVQRGKKSKENTLDFGVIADAIQSPQSDTMDFSQIGGAQTMDFSAGGGMDFGGGSGFDFSGGGGGSGGMDFGGGGAAPAPSGGGLDFGGGGNPAPAPSGGGLDFGAGGTAAPSGGGLDFGAGGGAPTTPRPQSGVTAVPTTAKEAIKQGLDLVEQVAPDSVFYPRAKYLTGLLHFLGGDDQKAVESFQEVVKVLNPRAGARLDPKLREMAFLSLARIHYGYKQFNRSAYYYDLIDRDSENWLTALFESSWAYYRRGDFEKALGNLLTLHSPFFEHEYFPESQIVKAIIYFEACRYPETRAIVDDFIKRFTALMHEMQKIAESKDAPEQLTDRIAALQAAAERESDDVTARVVSLTLNSPDIRQATAVLKQVEDQKKSLAQMSEKFRQSSLGVELIDSLRNAAADRAKNAGEVTRKKFEQELYKLKSLLAQALRIKIEVARSERDILEKKMQGQAGGDDLVQAVPRTVVDDEHVYWPYEGEYWRDELGTYELDFSMCRQLAAQ